MKVRIWMNSQSNGIHFENVTNTYTKDGMYCILFAEENYVYKYPLCNIWNVRETTFQHSTTDKVYKSNKH